MRQGQSLSADLRCNASNAAPYAAFKGLGASVGVLLQPEPAPLLARPPRSRPSPIAATAALRHMTSNAYEPWIVGGDKRHVVWEAVARNQGLLDVAEESPPPLTDGSPYYHPDAVYRGS
jgi:hypothetical protein